MYEQYDAIYTKFKNMQKTIYIFLWMHMYVVEACMGIRKSQFGILASSRPVWGGAHSWICNELFLRKDLKQMWQNVKI